MGIIRAITTVFFIISPALALQFVTIIGFPEHVAGLIYMTQGWISPEDVLSFRSDSVSREHLQNLLNQLADRSLPVIRLCDNFSKITNECIALPYFLLPLHDSDRNTLLRRPSPYIVHRNIEQATQGELSTVEDLVEKAITNLVNLGNLNALSDDELTVLGSNFHNSKPGWFIGKECTILDEGPWTEDQLVSEDEQRVLAAVFLHITRDPGYRGRQVEGLREEIQRFVQQRDSVLDKLHEATARELDWFTEGVKQLDEKEVIVEEEWLAQYDEYVAGLVMRLQIIASAGTNLSRHFVVAEYTVVTGAEEAMDRMIFSRLPVTEPAFYLFATRQAGAIKRKFPQIRQSLLYKFAYFRWKDFICQGTDAMP